MSRTIADISDWQKGIDFSLIKQKFDGVIFKAGEGQNASECFEEYARQAEAVGLPYGLYLYARALNTQDAEAEAVALLCRCKDANVNPTLGVWYDVEHPSIVGENGGEGIGSTAITASISAFISKMNANEVYAGVYAPWWVIRDRINTGALADYVPYWVSWVGAHNPLDDHPELVCAGWQNRVDGVNGVGVGDYFVDSSVWYI